MARVKIKELRLRNFRAFENARFVLDDKLTVVIGRNGSGKSTLMEAFEFIRDALLEGLVTALIKHGSISSISHKGAGFISSDVSLAIELSVDGRNVVYGFTIGISPSDLPFTMRGFHNFWITSERLVTSDGTSFFTRAGDQFNTDIVGIAPAPAQEALLLPQIANAASLWEEVLEALRQIHVYKLSPMVMREEQQPSGANGLSANGSNAGEILSKLAYREFSGQSQDVRWIVEHLASIVKGVIGIGPTASQTGKTSVTFVQRYNGAQNNFTAAQMSDGTLRSLGILLALRQEPAPTLVFFDEIEDSIDLPALEVLLEAIDERSEDFQVVVSSHNAELLSYPLIKGEKVRVVKWESGVSRIYNLADNVIEAIHPPYSVGLLLRENALSTTKYSIGVGTNFFEV